MSDGLIGGLGFLAALGLIALGVPVAVALGAVGIVGFWVLNGWTGVSFVLGSAPFEAIFPYSLSVVPLFVAMGVFAAHAGLSRALYGAVNVFVGHLKGGLAVATVGACALFGAICGSSLATAATMGRVAIPQMRAAGYKDSLAAASVAAGGTLGVLIPPSIILVIYGLLTETSIGALFVAALIPGLLGVVLYSAAVMVTVRLDPAQGPARPTVDGGERRRALSRVWPVLGLFALVIGGIYLGWFSPTEAAAVGAAGAFVLALAGGEMDRATLATSGREIAVMTGMIFFILVGAAFFNYFLETTGLPQAVVRWFDALGLGPTGTLIVILAFYVVLGCFLDALSMILLTVPFIFPLADALGFDPIWFGILIVTVAEIGLITPPVGMNLFVIQGTVPGLGQGTIVRGIVPFILADVVRLALLVGFPALALWLPSQMAP